MENHSFTARWITAPDIADVTPISVWHRQLDKTPLPEPKIKNRHILFRRKFTVQNDDNIILYITADDYYKLWINGCFVAQGPAPAYPFHYGYNRIDVTKWVQRGENVIAVHTYCQGLRNRVWVSGDDRHGLLLEMTCNNDIILCSDESFLCADHGGFSSVGVTGYDTQFLECYDASSPYTGFECITYDDSFWGKAAYRVHTDWVTVPQQSEMLVFENLEPVSCSGKAGDIIADFGGVRVGYPAFQMKGTTGSEVIIRCAQELDTTGGLRTKLRANCVYEEKMLLSGGVDEYNVYDYKSFRYCEIIFPKDAEINHIHMVARHYPFALHATPYFNDPKLKPVWELCKNTIRWGAQEVIQDCMEREKGFYLGDGCYTSLTHAVLTGDWSIVRKLIDDALRTQFITDGLVTCMDCSLMQEIAEYPLMLFPLVLAYMLMTDDLEFVKNKVNGLRAVLEDYRVNYEREDGLLSNLDKWCVVEWPANYQDGYDADIREGKVCTDAHCVINAYYVMAVDVYNRILRKLGLEEYRDSNIMRRRFFDAFYDKTSHLFRDRPESEHCSYPANGIVFGFGLWPDEESKEALLRMVKERTVEQLSFFVTFPVLFRLKRMGLDDEVERQMALPGTWTRMIREGADVTFEGWGKACKWNTSLFHLTMSDGALFLTRDLWDAIERKL